MTNRVPAELVPLTLIGVGIASSLITVAFQTRWLIPGAVFGVALALHLAFIGSVRKPYTLLAFVITCSVAYPVAIFGTIGLMRYLPDWSTTQGKPPPYIYFLGGTIGGLIVLFSGLFLFGARRASNFSFAFFWALGCGFLSLLGFGIDSVIGKHAPGNIGLAVFMIWQCSVAIALNFLLRNIYGQSEPQTSPVRSFDSK